jgi:hypothetical protein
MQLHAKVSQQAGYPFPKSRVVQRSMPQTRQSNAKSSATSQLDPGTAQSPEDALASILKVIGSTALVQQQRESAHPQSQPTATATTPAQAVVLSDADRATLQRHLAELAAQLAEIVNEEEGEEEERAGGDDEQMRVEIPEPPHPPSTRILSAELPGAQTTPSLLSGNTETREEEEEEEDMEMVLIA